MEHSLCKFGVNDVRVLVPVVNAHPHLSRHSLATIRNILLGKDRMLTLRNVLRPARMLPPIHVEYLRSGGAKILMRMSLTASFCSSVSRRSPKPLVSVLPPERTMLLYRDLRKSRSVRLIASTTIWCTPGYSRPIISGSNRISGARNLSAPICRRC